MKKYLLLFLAIAANLAAGGYEAKDYSKLLGMKGFSDALLKQHFTLYQGYVKNTNLLADKLRAIGDDKSPEFAGLKRMFGWEFDGMRLHELYFDNLGGKGSLPADSALYKEITSQFGSFENWKKDFIATGMIRGIGWSILYQDKETGRLFNTWINEHNVNHLALGKPLLVMDVWEHAFITEYGLNRADYINAFMDNVAWDVVNKRF